jgi:hypothetical protein
MEIKKTENFYNKKKFAKFFFEVQPLSTKALPSEVLLQLFCVHIRYTRQNNGKILFACT